MMWQNAGRSGIDQWNFVMSPSNASQDPTGRYTRRYVPELAKLPNKFLHCPWLATPEVLIAANVRLGETYPRRVVEDLVAERRASVESVLEMRRANQSLNDDKGYDLITVTPPSSSSRPFTSRVFTKEEYRIKRCGAVMPPPSRGRGGGRKKGGGGKGGGGKGSGGKGGVGSGGGANNKNKKTKKGAKDENSTPGAGTGGGASSQKRVTDFFTSSKV